MNSRRAKALRKMVTGDPDLTDRMYHTAENKTTQVLHPHSYRRQYQEAKKQMRRGE